VTEEDDPLFISADSPFPSTDDAIGVWYDLERALAGKNGYGGDVAEIYAYRLLPRTVSSAPAAIGEAQARLAGKNMTHLLKRFTKLYDVDVAVEEREGFRTIDLGCEEFPPFDWRAHVRVMRITPVLPPAPPIHEVREVLAATTAHLGVLSAMLDELAAHRARTRLGTNAAPPADTDDLPPDAPTGLYLDVPFCAEDLEWITAAWTAYQSRGGGEGFPRPTQLMLVFQAIRRSERATPEFLRAMNTIVLPLLRRLRLRDQPQLAKLGAAGE
jgi:hypothetical protein